MLAAWTELLPLFIVRWIARRNCEIVQAGQIKCFDARPGVLIFVSKPAATKEGAQQG